MTNTLKTDSAAPSTPLWHLGNIAFTRPTKLAVLLTVLLVGMCFSLGVWQVMRLQWKQGLIEELQQAQQAAPLEGKDLPVDEAGLEALNFRKVRLHGVFMDGREFHLIGRYNKGVSGYDVLVPFLVRDEARDEAQKPPLVVLVNRGWIPLDHKDPATRPEPLNALNGEVTVDGLLFFPRQGSHFLPDHDTARNVWFWYDTPRMSQETGLDLPPVIVEAVDPEHPQDVLPLPREDYHIELRNDHLSYAITWFALTFAGIVIFLLAHRHKPEGEGEA